MATTRDLFSFYRPKSQEGMTSECDLRAKSVPKQSAKFRDLDQGEGNPKRTTGKTENSVFALVSRSETTYQVLNRRVEGNATDISRTFQ